MIVRTGNEPTALVIQAGFNAGLSTPPARNTVFTNMLTFGGQILYPVAGSSCDIRPGVVHVDQDRIVGVEFGPIAKSVDFGNADTLISPGFIDTHLHLPQFDSIGAAGLGLLDWLEQVIYPAELRWNDLAFARQMIRRVARQCLNVGTTGICAYATVSHPSAMAALKAFDDFGFRGVIGQVMMDCGAPQALLRSPRQLVDEVALTLLRYPVDGRISAAVTPRFALSCSHELLHDAGRLADGSGAVIQTHLAETMAECLAVSDRFGGTAYVDVYADAGLLSERCLVAHGIYLDRASQDKLARSRSRIAHCPTANTFLASGKMDRESHLGCGIQLTLGSDIGAGYERSMVRVGRAMIETAMHIAVQREHSIEAGVNVPTAAQAWHQITTGNADALGWHDGGRIETHAAADLVVIQPDIPWLEAGQPLSTLMYAWDDRWIKQTVLRGTVHVIDR